MQSTLAATSTRRPASGLASALELGPVIFAIAVTGLGVETLVCAPLASHALGPQYTVVPVIPWVPGYAWLGYAFGVVLLACGLGMFSPRTLRPAALAFGAVFFVCAFVLDLPKYTPAPGDISLRTGFFEPLALASLAWLLPGTRGVPALIARFVLALSLIVFGYDHFPALAFIANLLPGWIPIHSVWVAFFGAAFIATGLSIAAGVLVRWSAGLLGLMFAIWVFTLHLPRVLGLYGIPNAPHSPAEWSSLLIAVGMWGGSWALARNAGR